MKDFLKHTLATVVGIIAASVIMGIIGIIALAGMIASEQTTTKVKENSVFVLNLSGSLEERAEEDVMAQLTGNVSSNLGLDDMLYAINAAKNNKDIKGIYIEAGAFVSDSPASSQAIRKVLPTSRRAENGLWHTVRHTHRPHTIYAPLPTKCC